MKGNTMHGHARKGKRQRGALAVEEGLAVEEDQVVNEGEEVMVVAVEERLGLEVRW